MKKPSDSPLVSVIVPTYNRSRLVAEAVRSVAAQDFRDFEIIVADDGSEDDTEEVLTALDILPKPYFLPLNHGGTPGRARNRGARIARGRYLAFLDSDDLWRPEKLRLQLDLFRRREEEGRPVRISHTRELWLRDGREVSQASQRHRREGDIFDDALIKCILGPSTVMLERELFEEQEGFREDLEIAEDYELWLRICFREEVAYLDSPLTVKRAGSGDQLSEKYGHIELFRIRALGDLLDRDFFALPPEKKEAARREFLRKCAIYAAGCRKRGKEEEAAKYERLMDLKNSDTLKGL